MKRYNYVANGIREDSKASSLREATARNVLGDLPAEDEAGYEEYLRGLSLADLQSHAPSMGVKPVGERKRLEKALKNAFRDRMRTYGSAIKRHQRTPVRPKDNAKTKKLRENAKRFR